MPDLKINEDFTKTAVISPEAYEWSSSPAKGVERMMLDRLGAESGHATSLVRFAPNTSFHEHSHSGGEEFLVLEGTFSDEHADYPAGSYVRNPIDTAHSPHVGDEGCTIFVKLCQFNPEDSKQFSVNTNELDWENAEGFQVKFLHEFNGVKTQLEKWPLNFKRSLAVEGGSELLILEGSLEFNGTAHEKGTWIRSLDPIELTNTNEELILYLKTGHLSPS